MAARLTTVVPSGRHGGAAGRKIASSIMDDQSLSQQAREAVLVAIIESAPRVGNSPAESMISAKAYVARRRI